MTDKNCVEILSRLIEFRSLSHSSNLDIADYIAQFATSRGCAVERFPSADGRKEGLLVTLGPKNPGGIVLSGHMDVVPPDNQNWTSDPYLLRSANGRLYGRGTADMKGFLAICLSALNAIDPSRLSRPLHLSFSYDEEITCEGVKPIIAHLKEFLPPPAAVIVGEPTKMAIVAAHKGAVDLSVEIHGKAAHSSLPHLGANAIYAAARIISFVEKMGDEFKDQACPTANLFDVPFTTLSVGLLTGGTAGNIIPSYCEFRMEARVVEPKHIQDILGRIRDFAGHSVLPYLKATAPSAQINVTALHEIPPLVRQRASTAERLIAGITGSDEVEAVSYATEAGYFQSAGMPTVVFGPGSIAQAHQPDEHITVEQLTKGLATFNEILMTLY